MRRSAPPPVKYARPRDAEPQASESVQYSVCDILHAGDAPCVCGRDVSAVHLVREADAVPIQCELEANVVVVIVSDSFDVALEGSSTRVELSDLDHSRLLLICWVNGSTCGAPLRGISLLGFVPRSNRETHGRISRRDWIRCDLA